MQRRRWWPTALIQGGQRLAHRALFGRRGALPDATGLPRPTNDTSPTSVNALPLPLRLLARFPALQRIPDRLIAIGPLPEHAPTWARRPPGSSAAHH